MDVPAGDTRPRSDPYLPRSGGATCGIRAVRTRQGDPGNGRPLSRETGAIFVISLVEAVFAISLRNNTISVDNSIPCRCTLLINFLIVFRSPINCLHTCISFRESPSPKHDPFPYPLEAKNGTKPTLSHLYRPLPSLHPF